MDDPLQYENWNKKLHILLISVGILFTVLIVRLFHLQITTFADYAKEAEDNRIHQKRIKAPRGRILDRNGAVLAENRASYTVYLISSSSKRNSETIVALNQALKENISLPLSKERSKRLKRDVDFETVCVVEERLMDNWPLAIEIEPRRQYQFGSTAAHLLGYMGEIQDNDMQKIPRGRYVSGDYVGRSGIEKVFEDVLRGQDGVHYIEMDAKLRIKNEHPFPERERNPKPGNDLKLTLNLDVQRAAQRALPDSLAGCIVVLDIQTGAVLAIANQPTFDPNVFVSFQSQEERLRLMASDNDLLNRSIQGLYPPGSTLKMVSSIAAIEAGVTDTLSTFAACAGSLQVGDVIFRCFNRDGHGELNLLEATETSCNIYFNQLAQILGMEAWRDTAAKFGFGQVTGFHAKLQENPGLLPSKRWYIEKEGGWVTGHLMNLVIGQGAMLVTPLQMARYVSALGNGGYLVTPHVHGPPPPKQKIDTISENTFGIVKESMRRVIYGKNGTGSRLRIDGLELAGKSGTAQVPNRPNDDAWFVAFAPYEQPEIAIVVVVEGGGGGGSVAAPIARTVLHSYFEDRLLHTTKRDLLQIRPTNRDERSSHVTISTRNRPVGT